MDRQKDSIARDIPVPYYFQLIQVVREKIAAGTWGPGQKLPSEAELCSYYGVSRTVVRAALDDLKRDGLIYRQKGRGTFVSAKLLVRKLDGLSGLYDDTVTQGRTPGSDLLEQTVVKATEHLAATMSLKPGELVHKIVRVRKVDEEPNAIVVNYIPCALAPGLASDDLVNQSLYSVLRDKYGMRLGQSRKSVEAVSMPRDVAGILGVRPGAPALLVRSVTWLEDGKCAEYYESVHRGDHTRLEFYTHDQGGEGSPIIGGARLLAGPSATP